MAVQAPLAQHFVDVQSLQPTSAGTISVSFSETHALSLSGSGVGWGSEEQTIRLRPATIPAYYRLTLELDAPAQFSLIGAQIFRQFTEEASSGHAAVFIPASAAGTVQLDLFHHIEDAPGLIYQLYIGIQDSNTDAILWPDPTISFEPQIIPPGVRPRH